MFTTRFQNIQQPGQPGKILPFPTKYKFEVNARFALSRLRRGDPSLAPAFLYGPYAPALIELALDVRVSRGRP